MISRRRILEAMEQVGLSHDPGDPKTFLAPRSLKRILDPSTFVVLGARGSGKSALAQYLVKQEQEAPEDWVARLTAHQMPGSYFSAFSQRETLHPWVQVLENYLSGQKRESVSFFWAIEIFFTMQKSNHWSPSEAIRAKETEQIFLSDPNLLDRYNARMAPMIARMLDSMEDNNRNLIATGKVPPGSSLIGIYDDLDLFGVFDPEVRAKIIGALLGMWTSFSTRYRHLKAKIFLPSDLFDLRLIDTVDTSKLMSRAVKLEWDDLSLYRLVLRHLGAQGEDVREWLGTFGFQFSDAGECGWMPEEPQLASVKAWLARVLRSVVSVNGTRAPVEQWILNRLRDAKGQVAPRSILTFFRESARLSLHRSTDENSPILAVQDAVGSLDEVGKQRVDEVRQVYEWVDRLEAMQGRYLPLPRPEIEALLEQDAPGAPKPTRPRAGRDVTTELLRLGMLRDLGDKLDVPDLFARHFGVQRGLIEKAG